MRKISRLFVAVLGIVAALMMALVVTPSASAESAQPSDPAVQIQDEAVQLNAGGGIQPMSANGCTNAPGPLGAHNCVVVNGKGLKIDSAYSQYYYAQPIGGAVCDRQHQFLYTLPNGQVVQPQVNAGGCINAAAMVVTGDYVSLPGTPVYAKDGTGFCTRAKNNQTGGLWTPWACITIHA